MDEAHKDTTVKIKVKYGTLEQNKVTNSQGMPTRDRSGPILFSHPIWATAVRKATIHGDRSGTQVDLKTVSFYE